MSRQRFSLRDPLERREIKQFSIGVTVACGLIGTVAGFHPIVGNLAGAALAGMIFLAGRLGGVISPK